MRKFRLVSMVLTLLIVLGMFSVRFQAAIAQCGPDAAEPSRTVFAGNLQSLPGHTPQVARDGRAIVMGHYEPTRMLRLAFMLTPPHVDEEQRFLEDIQNKKSPLVHQFLDTEEFTARFDPSAADEQAVVDWATSESLTRRYRHRLLVDVEALAHLVHTVPDGDARSGYQCKSAIRSLRLQ